MTELRAPELQTEQSTNGHRPPEPLTAPVRPPLRPRRRPALVALGVAMAAVGGLAVAVMLTQAGNRVAVLAVAKDVPVGAIVTADDLTIAHVSADSNLSPVRASEEASIVGQVAAVDLTAGSLLTRSDVNTGSSDLAAGQQLIGLPLKPGQMPARPLSAGLHVLIVATPGDFSGGTGIPGGSSTGAPTTIAATVVDVGQPASDGTVVVDVIVPASAGPQLAALASTGHLALLEQPAGG